MSEKPEFLAERLRSEGEKTYAFFAGLKPEQWQQTVYTEGETWTIHNILVHYVTAEKGFLSIFNRIREGGPGVPDDFDIDRYNAGQQRRSKDLTADELLKAFKEVRAQMVALVSTFSEEDLKKEGRHPYLGQTNLAEMVKMVYRHNQIHYRDMRGLIEEG